MEQALTTNDKRTILEYLALPSVKNDATGLLDSNYEYEVGKFGSNLVNQVLAENPNFLPYELTLLRDNGFDFAVNSYGNRNLIIYLWKMYPRLIANQKSRDHKTLVEILDMNNHNRLQQQVNQIQQPPSYPVIAPPINSNNAIVPAGNMSYLPNVQNNNYDLVAKASRHLRQKKMTVAEKIILFLIFLGLCGFALAWAVRFAGPILGIIVKVEILGQYDPNLGGFASNFSDTLAKFFVATDPWPYIKMIGLGWAVALIPSIALVAFYYLLKFIFAGRKVESWAILWHAVFFIVMISCIYSVLELIVAGAAQAYRLGHLQNWALDPNYMKMYILGCFPFIDFLGLMFFHAGDAAMETYKQLSFEITVAFVCIFLLIGLLIGYKKFVVFKQNGPVRYVYPQSMTANY